MHVLTIWLRLFELVVAGFDEGQVGLPESEQGVGVAAALLAPEQARRVLGQRALNLTVTRAHRQG